MYITIPAQEYTGLWSDFRRDNEAFITPEELDRLERDLKTKGVAIHKAHTAGDFAFLRVERPESVAA